jgi:hypothetical protein
LRSCKYLILAISIYVVALAVTWTIPYKYTLLGTVSLSSGILLHNIISRVGDVAFVLAISELFGNILWGIARDEEIPMSKVLALSTSTGIHGLLSIIISKSQQLRSSRYWAVLQYVKLNFG